MHSTLRTYMRNAHLANHYAEYLPNFHVEEFKPGCWWILDGEVKVGLVEEGNSHALLVNFDPFTPLYEITFPKIYHAPTQPGDRVTLKLWGVSWETTGGYSSSLTFTTLPAAVTLTFVEQWGTGQSARKTLTWKVDPDFGYMLHCEQEMHTPAPETAEYTNFLPQGTTDDRPEFQRYPYIVWQHPSGRLIRWNQNHIAAMGAAGGAIFDYTGERLITAGGFIGYFGEPDRGPALELLASTPHTSAMTCPNMLDEHIVWRYVDPAQDKPEGYTARAAYNLVSIPGAVCRQIAADAEMLSLQLVEEGDYTLHYALETSKTTDFETPIDPIQPYRGISIPVPAKDGRLQIVSDCAHSGTHSLRMQADGDTISFPWSGGNQHVTEGRRYRLSAWIKSDLSDGQAILLAKEYLFTGDNITAVHQAVPVTGNTDWQQVALEFTPGEKAHVVIITVEVSGHGTVCVDDILLAQA